MGDTLSIIDKFRNLTAWSLEAKVMCAIRAKGEDAQKVIKSLGTPTLQIRDKPHLQENGYIFDDKIVVVTNENQSLEDDADTAYISMISMLEQKGLGTPELRAKKLSLSDRLCTDNQGNPVRFTLADLETDYKGGPNADILRRAVKTLENLESDEAREVLDALTQGDIIIKLKPGGEYQRTTAQYMPQKHEINAFINPRAEEAEQIAAVAIKLLHEGCHYIQDRDGSLAEVAQEPDNYRELVHLNELQAHTVQYRVVMDVFSQSDAFKEFMNTDLSLGHLEEQWARSDNMNDKICLAYLIDQDTGRTIIENMQKRRADNDAVFDPHDLEGHVKEALNRGKITEFQNGEALYDETHLSRMQRYAHAHLPVLNFSGLGGSSSTKSGHDNQGDIDRAIENHFEGPLGMQRYNTDVQFADPDLAFISAINGREIRVRDVENMWEKEGGNALNSLGSGHTIHDKTIEDKYDAPFL